MEGVTSKQSEPHSLKMYNRVKKVVIYVLAVCLLLGGMNHISTKAADDTDSYNFQSVANTLSNVFSLGMTPTDIDSGITGVPVLTGINRYVGNAGLVLGGTTDPTSLGQWIACVLSGSSMAYDYSSLKNIKTMDGTATNTVYEFAIFGHLLSDLGIDKATTNTSGNSPLLRILGGYTTWIAYVFASLVYNLFVMVLGFLQAINPFFWFDGVVKNAIGVGTTDEGYFTYQDPGGTSAIGVLKATIAEVYIFFANFSWALIIPMMLALYFFNFFVLKKTHGTKRLLIRLVFLSVGVPVLGGLYTGFLEDMQQMFTSQMTSCDQIVLSTYVDFENWAKKTRLAVNNNMTLVADTSLGNGNLSGTAGSATSASIANLRKTCLAINQLSGASGVSMRDAIFNAGGTGVNSSITLEDVEDVVDETIQSSRLGSINGYTANLIWRYATGDRYTADAFASYEQTQISHDQIQSSESISWSNKPGTAKAYYKVLAASSNLNSYKSMNTGFANAINWVSDKWKGNIHFDSTSLTGVTGADDTREYLACKDNDIEVNGYRYSTIFNNGHLGINHPDNNGNLYSFTTVNYSGNDINGSSAWPGLSTMSMYNYLNCAFEDSAVYIYGGGSKIASALTNKQHFSVNLIGRGLMGFMYWADCISMLTCISIIGIFYSVGMLSHSIKNVFEVMKTLPGALLGSLRGMAKFVGIVASMVTNVLVTAIFYALATNALIGFSQLVEGLFTQSVDNGNVFQNMLNSTMATVNPTGTMGLILLSRLVVTIVTIYITVQLIRIRKSAIKGVNEYITQIVGKFFEADAHRDPEKPKANLGQKIAGGVMQGVGMAAGLGMQQVANQAIGGALRGAVGGDDPNNPPRGGGGGDDNTPPPPPGGGSDGGANTITGHTIETESGDSVNNSFNGIEGGDNLTTGRLEANNSTNVGTQISTDAKGGSRSSTSNSTHSANIGGSENSTLNEAGGTNIGGAINMAGDVKGAADKASEAKDAMEAGDKQEALSKGAGAVSDAANAAQKADVPLSGSVKQVSGAVETLTDKNASTGEKLKDVTKAGVTVAADVFSGGSAGTEVSKAADAIDSAGTKAMNAGQQAVEAGKNIGSEMSAEVGNDGQLNGNSGSPVAGGTSTDVDMGANGTQNANGENGNNNSGANGAQSADDNSPVIRPLNQQNNGVIGSTPQGMPSSPSAGGPAQPNGPASANASSTPNGPANNNGSAPKGPNGGGSGSGPNGPKGPNGNGGSGSGPNGPNGPKGPNGGGSGSTPNGPRGGNGSGSNGTRGAQPVSGGNGGVRQVNNGPTSMNGGNGNIQQVNNGPTTVNQTNRGPVINASANTGQSTMTQNNQGKSLTAQANMGTNNMQQNNAGNGGVKQLNAGPQNNMQQNNIGNGGVKQLNAGPQNNTMQNNGAQGAVQQTNVGTNNTMQNNTSTSFNSAYNQSYQNVTINNNIQGGGGAPAPVGGAPATPAPTGGAPSGPAPAPAPTPNAPQAPRGPVTS